MEDLINQLTTIVRRMWKFRWPALLAAWFVAIAGAVVVFYVPDKYEATARIFVDTQSILKPLMSGLTVQPNVEQQVGMLSRTLISRPNVEKLIRMADLDLKNESKAQQEALIESLTKSLEIRGTNRDNLYSLSYRDADKEKAKRVIQSLVSIFVESSLGASRKDTDSAKVFLNEQIKTYEAKLEEAETRLKEFRLRNLDLQTADGRDSASRLGEISKQLEQARLELREAENAREAAKQQLAAEKQSNTSVTQSLLQESSVSVSTPELDGRIAEHKRNLDALLQRYTEQHPDIISTRRLLKDLEEQKKKEIAEQRKLALSQPAAAAPQSGLAFQELNRLLATSEVQVASLRARVAEYSSRYAQARAALKTSPQIEAEAAQLNRDYAIIKKNYEDLVARRQAAVMSGDLDVASGVADFRLIDPPRVSSRPVSPNRFLLYPLALAAALGVGLFVAFAASQLRPVYDAAYELRAKTGLPVLGVVSLVLSDGDTRRARVDLLRFLAGSGSLVGVYVIGLIALTVIVSRQVG
ncbi:chain length-determining protein [Aquincola sp. S2]|uniref:Chain length-determining protein n=1 Tax=Pseudaquabacterium terrae TaxID=2732868 RepID=A0ABX2ED71_9BURK|nr:XrtA system polysaccharide chain length determinant [Aquabacterium terrae]NRF66492.1 chain length-determining protein [Aquabacterium terrae]